MVNHPETRTSKTWLATLALGLPVLPSCCFTARSVGEACERLPAWDVFAVFPVQEHKQTISREDSSEVIRTRCAHSFTPNSLRRSSSRLCLTSSLLCVCLFFVCCRSALFWIPITLPLSLPACHKISPTWLFLSWLFLSACVSWRDCLRVCWRSYLHRKDGASRPDVRRMK